MECPAMTSPQPTSPTAAPPMRTATSRNDTARPPPLPPRQPESPFPAMASVDSHSSTVQSIAPSAGQDLAGRRTLLLVYIHGFMGDETSFQSFPAHLHNLLTITMSESHAVYTKVYPKYRSRYALEVARDGFSQWLTPHENSSTDVILLGHSMGGLLAADIALLFRHNIIGVVNFDVPFLGMHPGIVKAGLGSIFSPWPAPENVPGEEPQDGRPGRMNTLFNPRPQDPNYNPNFHNDVHLPARKGWQNTLHFINKHSNGLVAAGKNLIKSHVQFGGAMADYPTLKARYARIRALEEDNEAVRRSANPGVPYIPRIRFVNYYTASTGRPKKPKSPKSPSPSRPVSRGLPAPEASTNSQLDVAKRPHSVSGTVSPRISVDEYRDNEVVRVSTEEPLSTIPSPSHVSPNEQIPSSRASLESNPTPGLPTIPPMPQEPAFVDFSQYTDKNERKGAEKEQSRLLKEYKRAVKARNAAIKERAKAEKKLASQHPPPAPDTSQQLETVTNGPEATPLEDDVASLQLGSQTPVPDLTSPSPYNNYVFSRSTILAQPSPDSQSQSQSTPSLSPSLTPSTSHTNHNPESTDTTALPLTAQDSHDTTTAAPQKKKRMKKFCMLPPKDAHGNPDPTWIRVFMQGVDEVTAHTTLFFMSETYERLVGDVAARIEEWVRENDSVRLAREMQGGCW